MDTTVWRWFPAGLIAALGVVVAVNGFMMYNAYHTFPGAAGTDGFDLSNNYKQVLAAQRAQAALGWRIEASATEDHFPALRLTGRDGAALAATLIDARAERPVGPLESTELAFRPVGDGRFQAGTSLFSGQWDVMLTVHADGQQYSATRRIFVK